MRRQCYSIFQGLTSKERVPDVELSTWSAGAGVIQSNAHQDRLSEGAQRNIHLWTEREERHLLISNEFMK